MAERPPFCPDPTCTPLTSLADVGDDKTGTCIGKLAQAADHGNLKGINDKRWCLMSGNLSSIMLNNEDMELFIYQMAIGAERDGTPLKFWLLDHVARSRNAASG